MQTKKRKMKAGEALVGMKRRGSQLWAREQGQLGFAGGRNGAGRGEIGRGRRPYLRKQNMVTAV